MHRSPPAIGTGFATAILATALLTQACEASPVARAAVTRPEKPANPGSDWNGSWRMDPSGGPRGALIMFDPKHAYLEPDPAPGDISFGPMPGSKLTDVPYKPDYQRAYDQIVQKTKEGLATDGLAVGCRPYGMPRVMSGNPYGFEMIVLPELVAMVFDVDTRMIHTDGRKHPAGDDVSYTWEGHSIGHWEGTTLLIDTVAMYAGNYDQTNAPHSDQIHVTERLHLLDHDTMQDDITVEDPVMLVRPWQVTRIYKRSPIKWPDKAISNCGPDDSVEMVGGHQNLILPSEREHR
jgi:hypothetical protein